MLRLRYLLSQHRKMDPCDPDFDVLVDVIRRTLAMFLIVLTAADCFAQVHVRGYIRKNGTYVAPHYRSAPDGNFYNNWSTKGNVNPYTGKEGTRVSPPASVSSTSLWPSGATRTEGSQSPCPITAHEEDIQPSLPNKDQVEGTNKQILSASDSTKMYVSRIQTKLKNLGYYKLAIDGIWGPKSRAGLQSFKVDRGLGNDDAWNPTVEKALWGETKETNPQEPISDSSASGEGTLQTPLGTSSRSPDDVHNGAEAHDSKK